MTDKELRRLGRAELLELLLEKTRACEELIARLEEAERQLNDRTLRVQKAGSMAEAALLVSGVLESAQRAADLYLENLQERQNAQEETCARLEAESRARARQLMEETREKCRQMEQDAQTRCDAICQAAQEQANGRWDELFAQLDALQTENQSLRQALEQSGDSGKRKKWGR